MKRLSLQPRANWQEEVERVGLSFHTVDGVPYWDESACYRFASGEIDRIEAATAELQRLCLKQASSFWITTASTTFEFPSSPAMPFVARGKPSRHRIYGRFDLSYDGVNPPKLLEYNANTPTSLLEASVVQWHWRQDVMPSTDQFNSIHEKLISQWADIRPYIKG